MAKPQLEKLCLYTVTPESYSPEYDYMKVNFYKKFQYVAPLLTSYHAL